MRDVDSIISDLQPTLASLEPERLAYKRKSKVFFLIAGGVCVLLLLTGLATEMLFPFVIGTVFAGVIATIAFSFTIGKGKTRYVNKFKSVVIPRVLELISPDLQFDPHQGINEGTFRHSELFSTGPDRYSTEDLVRGTYDKTQITLAEIDAEERRTRTSNGKRETYYVTIFRGLLLIADFHKHFHGRTFVFPDTAENLFGRLGRGLQKLGGRSGTRLIQLEDPEFEKSFAIYSNDEVECRYILSTAMMRRLLDMRNRFGEKDIRVAFKDSCVWIAIPFSKQFLEPRIGVPATESGQVRHMLNQLQAILVIVDELNLNTRIWTKE